MKVEYPVNCCLAHIKIITVNQSNVSVIIHELKILEQGASSIRGMHRQHFKNHHGAVIEV